MYVNPGVRAWRRRNEQLSLIAAASLAEAHFAAFSYAVSTLLDDPVGGCWMERFGIDRRSPPRSTRLSKDGGAEGLSVIEAVVLAGMAGGLLSNLTLCGGYQGCIRLYWPPFISRQNPLRPFIRPLMTRLGRLVKQNDDLCIAAVLRRWGTLGPLPNPRTPMDGDDDARTVVPLSLL